MYFEWLADYGTSLRLANKLLPTSQQIMVYWDNGVLTSGEVMIRTAIRSIKFLPCYIIIASAKSLYI